LRCCQSHAHRAGVADGTVDRVIAVVGTTVEDEITDEGFGLTTSIFTRDIERALRFVDRIDTGMVHVNEATVGGEAQLPFGGTKATGVGDREMGEPGLHFFTELKTVFINYSARSARAMNR